MKRILFFLLLLVNLQLTTDNGSLSIGFGEVAAQSMKEETLDNVTVYGGGNSWTHCGCGKYVYRSQLDYHLDYECPSRTYTCGYCKKTYRWNQAHSCGTSRYSTGGGGGGGSSSSNTNGGSSSQSSTQQTKQSSSQDQYSRISLKELYALRNVTLITNLHKLQDRLRVQCRDKECVVRAIAFMLQLMYPNEVNYQKVFMELTQIAEKEAKYDLDRKGVPLTAIPYIFNSYCKENGYGKKIDCQGYTYAEDFIKQGIPVAACKNNHMVTIIGYDNDYYYVAAGNEEGSANKILKSELQKDYNKVFIIDK